VGVCGCVCVVCVFVCVCGLWDNTKIHFTELVLEGLDWIQLTQNNFKRWAFVNTVMKIWFL
jgi:hypothetical protein